MSALLNAIACDSSVDFFSPVKCKYGWRDFDMIYQENAQTGDFTISSMLATKLMMPYIKSRAFLPAGRSRDDEAEDYIQDVYLEIRKAMSNYNPSLSSFPQYIQKTISGVAATHARGGISKYQKDHKLTCEVTNSFDAVLNPSATTAEQRTLGDIYEGDSMETSIDRLSQDRKSIIYSCLSLDVEKRTPQNNYEIVALNKLLGGYEEWNYKVQEVFAKNVRTLYKHLDLTLNRPEEDGPYLDDYNEKK